MKKLLIVFLFLLINETAFSQENAYGLSQNDLNLLLGVFLPITERERHIPITRYFPWGRQIYYVYHHNQDQVHIFFAPKWFVERFGRGYERHLMISDFGIVFLITRIDKLTETEFKLELNLVQIHETQNFGSITITFLNNYYAIFDATNFKSAGSFQYGKMQKVAGPNIFQDQRTE